jgi:hypothetical protein
VKVKFRTTLGSRDAAECSRHASQVIDHAVCVIGEEVEVNAKAAEWLAARGLIEETELPKKIKAVPKPAKVRGVEEGEQFLKDYKKEESKSG